MLGRLQGAAVFPSVYGYARVSLAVRIVGRSAFLSLRERQEQSTLADRGGGRELCQRFSTGADRLHAVFRAPLRPTSLAMHSAHDHRAPCETSGLAASARGPSRLLVEADIATENVHCRYCVCHTSKHGTRLGRHR